MRRRLALAPALALALALALAAGAPGAAEEIRVRSGDHRGFTRLVVEAATASDWRLGRVAGGYALDLGRADVSFDLSQVFRLISRQRLATVRQDAASGRLVLEVPCDCRAVASTFRGTWLVIDVSDGAPEAGSPFEVALESTSPAEAAAREEAAGPQSASAAGLTTRPAPGADWSTARAAGLAQIGAGVASMPRGPGLWPIPASGDASTEQVPDGTVAEAAERDAVVAAAPASPATLTSADTAIDSRPLWRADPLRDAWTGQFGAMIAGDPASGSAGTGAAGEETAAAERIATQESLLLEELSRAASQGLLEANLPGLERASQSAAGGAAGGEAVPVAVATAPEPPPAPAPKDHVRMQAETSIDRDTGANRAARAATSEGQACLSDGLFDFAAWGDELDPSEGITERRKGLVGEFDRPDPAVVLRLARYYLFLGFGAEARSTLAAFQTPLPETEAVTRLAEVLDGDRGALPGILAGQYACSGRAALWSTLAEEGPLPGGAPNTVAILAAFSELPLHLRRHLGPALAERFLATGDRDTAIALRNAIARAPGDHGANFELLDARIGMAEGRDFDPAALETIVATNDALAPAALAAYLGSELDAGRVPDRAPETAAAFAFEIAGTDTGIELSELALRGFLAAGDFATGRAEIQRFEEERGVAVPALWSAFADALTRGAPDAEFLRQAFASRDDLARSIGEGEVATAIARRLTGLGFPEEALRYLPVSVADEAGRIARADALLASAAPAEAFGTVAGMQGPAVDRLRAHALLALGDARGAAERFRDAGDAASSERAAWLAGAWDLLAESEDPALRQVAVQRGGGSPRAAGTSGAATLDPAAPQSGPGQVPDTAQAGAAPSGGFADAAGGVSGDVVGTTATAAPVSASADAQAEGTPVAAAPVGGNPAPGGRVARAEAVLAEVQSTRAALEALLARRPVAAPAP